MAALSTLMDAFTAGTINASLWNSVTGGAATLDTVNDQIVLASPTTNGANNSFGSSIAWDARGSQIYAQIGAVPNGSGGTKTSFKLTLDAGNSTSLRIESGVFKFTMQIAGTTATTVLPTYDPHAHRWWRLRETGGTFFGEASPDGLNWSVLTSATYSWSAAAITFGFQTGALVTEVAGNSATIAHVNTRAGGRLNASWPVAEYGAGLAWGANAGTTPRDVYVDVSLRTHGTTSINRGRQYELDQVRAGEESVSLTNSDGALDPTTTTVYPGRIQPFQPMRLRAQWPPTINLLSQGVATGGDIASVSAGPITVSGDLDLLSDTDSTGGQITATASAWAGARVASFTVGTGAAVGARIAHCAQCAVIPGQSYTLQLRVRNITASTSIQVKAHLGWFGASSQTVPATYTYGGTVTLTGSATATWTTVTVTGTAPAGAYGLDAGVAVAVAPTGFCGVQTDGGQLERGTVASAWAMPGIWYPMYAGFTQDWGSQWALSGTFGSVTPSSADTFSLLSQLTLSDALTEETDARNPRFLYTLGDPAGSTGATDTTGSFPAVPIAVGKYGAGTLSFGNAITSASPAGVYTGGAGTVVTINNPTPGTGGPSAASFLDLGAAGIKGPATGSFSRMIAFRYVAAAPAVEADIWCSLDTHHGLNPSDMLRLLVDPSGHVQFIMSSLAAGPAGVVTTATVADSNWHLAVFGYDATTKIMFLSLDTEYDALDTTPLGGNFYPSGLVSDAIGAFVDGALGGATIYTFKGDVSYVAEVPVSLSSVDCAQIYGAWRNACSGESTDARYARILRYAGYTGSTAIQTGLTTNMGPANIGGQDAVSALSAVVTTENGEHFVARDGTITFRARSARYNTTVPVYTFGERTDLGEWPYEDWQPVFDSSHLGNMVTVAREDGGQQSYARDAASIAAYFPRNLDRTINSASALECQDAADYLLSRYKAPLTRIVSLKLHPSANPAMWPVCLGLELGTRVRVMRRPPGLPTTQSECVVENIAWTLDENNDAVQILQCSPADTTPYAAFAAWHSTLAAGIASGVSSITVNASQDNTNPLATQMTSGQQLVLGQNTANQETVTVSAVGATSTGWTTATLTLTAPTTKSHASGDVVCEPLPAGITGPTTWDAVSAFDASAFAY